MANNPIKSEHIIENGAVEEVNKLISGLQLALQAKRDFIAGVKFDNSQGLKEYTEEIKKATLAEISLLKIKQEQEKLAKIAIQTQAAERKEKDASTKATEKATKAQEKANSEYETAKKNLNDLKNKLKEHAFANNLSNEELRKTQKEFAELDKKVRKAEEGVGEFSRNVGNYKSALEGMPGPLGNVAQGVEGVRGAFNKLLANPIIFIIAAITAGLVGLFKAFTSTDEGGNKFAAVMEQVSAVVDVLRQRAAGLARGIADVFSGNWKEAAKEFSGAVSGIKDQMEQAAKAAKEYIYALDELEDAMIGYTSQRAINANKIAKLEFIAADKTKTLAVRKAALQQAIQIGEAESKKDEEFARRRYKLEIEKAAKLNGISEKSLKEFIEADDLKQETLLKNDANLARVRNNINDEGQQKLEDFFKATIEANTRFLEENKRNEGKLTGFFEEVNAAKDKLAQDEIERRRKFLTESKKTSLITEKEAEEELKRLDQEGIRIIELDRIKDNAESKDISRGYRQRAAAKLNEIERKRQFQESLKDLENITSALSQELDKRNQRQSESLNYDLDEKHRAIQQQQELANRGLANDLAFEKSAAAKLELQRKEAAEKQRKQDEAIKLAQLFLSNLNQKIAGGEDYGKASLEAIAETLGSKIIAQTIAGAFFDGTKGDKTVAESLGKPQLAGKDGYIVRVDGSERVFNGTHTQMLGGMTNEEIAKMARGYQSGEYLPSYALETGLSANSGQNMSNSVVLMQLRSIDKKMSYLEQIANKPEIAWGMENNGDVIKTIAKQGILSRERIKSKRNWI